MNENRIKWKGFVLLGLVLVLLLASMTFLTNPYSVEAGKPPTKTPKPTKTPTPTATPPAQHSLTCPTATTLEQLATCIASQMLGSGEGYVAPNSTVQSDWRNVVRQMLDGSCDTVTLPASLSANYSIGTFHDSGNGQDYCVLREDTDADGNGKVDKGWGTVIVNPDPVRELSINAVHPLYDIGTENEAVGIFKGTDSRTCILAGTHRNASNTDSSCQDNYMLSDVPHEVANNVQPTMQELMSWYDSREMTFTVIQYHGMAADSCSGHVHMTYGVTTTPASDDKIRTLKSNILYYHPTWVVSLPGDGPSCSLNGTTNTQGRLLNNVSASSVCGTSASSYSGKFIHIEQDPAYRTASDWIPVINDTWP